ncbi:hypothetical protein [Ancylobacter defluvii]|uniref:Uncharacterized protein n=1 Tax=Ancylobacter defluvii TaxID=1282440 RepID=A0A9W6NBN2_9HYPH|nr:hypothetical protein [Ancylobacter defluvii]MBS7586423.1 hypothetical protein [Ancylobacter defluvii]GLK85704.1 hypothetical protein GCM10017653_37740 [Ancylobacter defluvii]
MRLPRIAFAVLCLAIVAAVPARAADAVLSAGVVFDAVQPYLQATVSAAVIAILTWGAAAFQRWTGIQVEAKHREALHSAAMTGVSWALDKVGARLDTLTVDTRLRVLAQAAQWVETSVPDAVRSLGVTPDKIETLVAAKLGALIAGAK